MNLREIAKTYIGTPHRNGGDLKGVALDCCSLITHLYQEAGYGKIPITFGYSNNWFCKQHTEELMLPYLEKYFYRKEKAEIGDCITYRWGRAEYAHISMVIDDGIVIHCDADDGVEITDIDSPKFFDKNGRSRVSGIWGMKK